MPNGQYSNKILKPNSVFLNRRFLNKRFGQTVLASSGGGGGAYDPATDPSVVQWLKTDGLIYNTGTTQATNGQSAETWVASIGQNLLQTTEANKLIFNTNVQNGKPALIDDNSASIRWMTSSSFGTLAQAYTVWIVMKASVTSGNPIFFDGLTSSNRAVFYGNGSNWDVFAGLDTNGGAMDTNWHIFCLKYNGASSSITIDGGAATTVNAGANSFVGITLNALYDHSLRGAASYGEIIVQNALPSNESGTRLYLNNRWLTY